MGDSIAYIDESGGLDTPSFVLGGYLAQRSVWGAFTEDWRSVLSREPAWPALHMAPCHRARDEPWRSFTRMDRMTRIDELIDVVRSHEVHAFLATIRTDDLRAAEARHESIKQISSGYPYLMAAGAVIFNLLRFHEAKEIDFGTIDFKFDFHQQFQGAVREELLDSIQPLMAEEFPELCARLGSVEWIEGAEKSNHLPLQAADMLVWHWRRGRDEPSGGTRHWGNLRMAAKPLLLKYPNHREFGEFFTAHL